MEDVGIRALKQNASAVVARVARGETLTVTDRGRPVAQLSPIPSSKLAVLISAGQARPAKKPLLDLAFPPPGLEISGELMSMREEERY